MKRYIKQFVLIAAILMVQMGGRAPASDPDTFSPVVSFLYMESVDEPEAVATLMSPVVSYQYFDWPGDENLTFQNSLPISFFFDGTPVITSQPENRLSLTGGSAVFGVQVAVNPPFSYQWFKNGSSLPGKTGAILTLSGSSVADSGLYSVKVSNSYSSVTSLAAQLSVYTGPSTQKPLAPAIRTTTANSTSSTRLEAMTAPPANTGALWTYNSRIGDFDSGTLDPAKPTVVLTHGWKSSSQEWPWKVAQALVRKNYNLNIVAWQWSGNATLSAIDPSASALRTPAEGLALGRALLAKLGPAYQHQIHFIGHSLGTMVNCAAADFLHGDAKTKPAKNMGAYLPANTSLTLLDEAKLVSAVKGLRVFIDLLRIDNGWGDSLAAADDALYTLKNMWSKVIPTQHGFVDNYISDIGLFHRDTANVMLYRASALDDIVTAHGEAYDWYIRSIEDARATKVGYNWSFSPPQTSGYFNQSFNPDPSFEFSLTPMTLLQATELRFVVYPELQAVQGLISLGNYVEGAYLSGVNVVGQAVATYISSFRGPSGKPVYLGTDGSTPAFFAAPGAAPQTSQAQWNLQLILQGQGAASSSASSALLKTQPVDSPNSYASTSMGENANFVVMSVHVPLEAVGMNFEYQLSGASDGDFMTVCIDDKNVFTMEADFVEDGGWNGVPMCQMSDYRDHDVDLTFSLNGQSAPSAGTLAVRNIKFHIPQRPVLSVDVTGGQATLAWPLSGIDWIVETTTNISDPNSWAPVGNSPTDVKYNHTINFGTAGQARQFFRLKKTAEP